MPSLKDLMSDKARGAAASVGVALSADIVLFNAAIDRGTQRRTLKALESRSRRPNVFLMLVSEGGDPAAAYKISRSLQALYERFICYLPAYSKSAATIVLTGAHELVIGDDGEMGPLDIQMSKKDTLADYESGLTVLNALTALHEKAYLAWEYFFMETEDRSSGSITVKTAAHMASELTTGLFGPVYQQIDPLQLGEASRAMTIGNEYVKRLTKTSRNLRPGALETLVSGYPDHGFVIDRTEAASLFYRVRKATADEASLSHCLEEFCDVENGRKIGLIDFLNDEAEAKPIEESKGETHAATGAQAAYSGDGTNAPVEVTGADVSANGHAAG